MSVYWEITLNFIIFYFSILRIIHKNTKFVQCEIFNGIWEFKRKYKEYCIFNVFYETSWWNKGGKNIISLVD